MDRKELVRELRVRAQPPSNCHITDEKARLLGAAADMLETDEHIDALRTAAANRIKELEAQLQAERFEVQRLTQRVSDEAAHSTAMRDLVTDLKNKVAELQAPAPPPSVTLNWEPESNRVVVTYGDAANGVRIVTRRS